MDISNINLKTSCLGNQSSLNYSENSGHKIENIDNKKSNSTPIIESKEYVSSTREKVKEAIESIIEEANEKLEPIDKEISYDLHEKLNRFIITIKDKNSGEIIKEIPAKKYIDMFAKILEDVGLLFDQKS